MYCNRHKIPKCYDTFSQPSLLCVVGTYFEGQDKGLS